MADSKVTATPGSARATIGRRSEAVTVVIASDTREPQRPRRHRPTRRNRPPWGVEGRGLGLLLLGAWLRRPCASVNSVWGLRLSESRLKYQYTSTLVHIVHNAQP